MTNKVENTPERAATDSRAVEWFEWWLRDNQDDAARLRRNGDVSLTGDVLRSGSTYAAIATVDDGDEIEYVLITVADNRLHAIDGGGRAGFFESREDAIAAFVRRGRTYAVVAEGKA